MKLNKKLIAENIKVISESIDRVIKYDHFVSECLDKRYKKIKEQLIKESVKLKYMFGMSLNEALKVATPGLDDKVILESARQHEQLAENILSNDEKRQLLATLETILFGYNNKILESYFNENEDLGITLQKAVVKGLLESLVSLVEACKRKKKAKKQG